MGKKIAIVGSGCSGIGALWALKSTDHEVHLYEAGSRLGGHTNTVKFEGPSGKIIYVDTGFIVFNTATYPNLINFFKHVGVDTVKTDMTFGISRDEGKFEWSGTSVSSIFAQRQNIFSLRMWRLIFDIIRFNQFALDLLQQDDNSDDDETASKRKKGWENSLGESVGGYLDKEGYSQAFRDDYLVPMTAAVWSTNVDKCSLEFPVITLVRFMWNHHLLSTVSVRPDWMTIKGCSQQYIDAVLKDFPPEKVHLNTKVTSLTPDKQGRVTVSAGGADQVFDHVILATHGDQALEILQPVATKEEIDILSGFQTSKNVAVLHSDLSLMPKRRIAWSSWNYITESPFPTSTGGNISKVCLTYWMNLLQHIPEKEVGPVLVTLNPLTPPDPQLSQGIWEYSHPMYNSAAIRSQRLLPRIQNTRGISYCGAWTKYGFHEDGFSSGLSAAINHLGAELPFEYVDSTYSRGKKPILTWKNHIARILILIIHLLIMIGSLIFKKLHNGLDRMVATQRRKAE